MSLRQREPRIHHYHPRFLMRGHCFDSKREKTYYVNGDKPATERRIERLFCEPHGYSKIRDDWVREQRGAIKKWDASTEIYLSENVEGPTSELIQRILRAFAETTDLVFESTVEEKALLVRFFQLQLQRQEPDWMRELARDATKTGLEVTRLEHSDDDGWHEVEEVISRNPDYFQRLVTCEFLGDIDNLSKEDFNDLMRSRISVIQATACLPQKHLISGRKPIVPIFVHLSGDRISEGSQFFVAVSSNMGICLETCWRPTNRIYLCRERLPLNEVTKVNDNVYVFSEGEIIGKNRDLLNKVRDRNRRLQRLSE